MAPFKSGGGVLCIAALELVVGLALLGVFEVSVSPPTRRDGEAPRDERRAPCLPDQCRHSTSILMIKA